MQLLLHFLHNAGWPALDKAFFKKLYSIPIIQLILLRYFVYLLLNLSSRKHPKVVISRRSCLFSPPYKVPSRTSYLPWEVLPMLGLHRWQLSSCELSVPAKRFVTH